MIITIFRNSSSKSSLIKKIVRYAELSFTFLLSSSALDVRLDSVLCGGKLSCLESPVASRYNLYNLGRRSRRGRKHEKINSHSLLKHIV